MLQTILQFIILPLASGALGGRVFFRLFGEKISPEIRLVKIILFLFISQVIMVLTLYLFLNKFRVDNISEIIASMIAALILTILPYFAGMSIVITILLWFNKLFFKERGISRPLLIYGSSTSGISSGVIAGVYLILIGENYIKHYGEFLFPIYISIFILLGTLGGWLALSLSHRQSDKK